VADALRERPGDQPLPVPNDRPGIHSMVIDDLQTFPQVERAQRMSTDLAARRALDIQRYGVHLQPFNGRDVVRDLYEELLDGMVYAKQSIIEGHDIEDVYLSLRHMAFIVRGVLDRREVSHG
jgi:hypothetical protein